MYQEMKLRRTKAFVKAKELLTCKRVIEQERERYLALAEEHEETVRYLKKVEMLLEQERAASCYYYDCREVLLMNIYRNIDKSPVVKQMRDDFREFNKYASEHFREKYNKIRMEGTKGRVI